MEPLLQADSCVDAKKKKKNACCRLIPSEVFDGVGVLSELREQRCPRSGVAVELQTCTLLDVAADAV